MRMRLACLALALAACAGGLASSGPAAASVPISITIGAPPPPVIVYHEEPRWVVVPRSRVYVVEEEDRPAYDEFRYGGWFYIFNGGFWYRSAHWGGPFIAVHERLVPNAVMVVPEEHWRHPPHPHGMPPGQAKKFYGADDRGWRHGHGHGRGRDRD
jgi:hypothetical protein